MKTSFYFGLVLLSLIISNVFSNNQDLDKNKDDDSNKDLKEAVSNILNYFKVSSSNNSSLNTTLIN